MGFGQPSGPPASRQQLEELEALLADEGYSGFRDARGPMGFTQRQAGGKFTRDEAQEFIDELLAAVDRRNEQAAQQASADEPSEAASASSPEPPNALAEVPADELAAELRRRGWSVTEP